MTDLNCVAVVALSFMLEGMNEVQIQAGPEVLFGNLIIPEKPQEPSSFLSMAAGAAGTVRRNRFVARTLNNAGLATLLFDLLTPEEEAIDLHTREHRFNIGLLAEAPRSRHKMGHATGANPRSTRRLFRLEHRRCSGARCSS